MTRLVQLLRQVEFHIVVFCTLFILLNWPFLAVSGRHGLMGIFLYLFVLWSIFILLLFLIQRSLRDMTSGEDGD